MYLSSKFNFCSKPLDYTKIYWLYDLGPQERLHYLNHVVYSIYQYISYTYAYGLLYHNFIGCSYFTFTKLELLYHLIKMNTDYLKKLITNNSEK